MKPGSALAVSVSRGCVISSALIMVLPLIEHEHAIWFAMPITELLVAIYAIRKIIACTKGLTKKETQS